MFDAAYHFSGAHEHWDRPRLVRAKKSCFKPTKTRHSSASEVGSIWADAIWHVLLALYAYCLAQSAVGFEARHRARRKGMRCLIRGEKENNNRNGSLISALRWQILRKKCNV